MGLAVMSMSTILRQRAEAAASTLVVHPLRKTDHWPQPPYAQVFKCGVLPYRIAADGVYEYYLFEPVAKLPEKGPPGFQIAKGTREIFDPEAQDWVDYASSAQIDKSGEEYLEPLFVTAIREGIEEIGLKPESIEQAFEWGETVITSARTGESKVMWLYALCMRSSCVFDEPDKNAAATHARRWFRLDGQQAADFIRKDHLKIITKIDQQLQKKDI